MQVDVLLFDLGGVLVEWDGTTPLIEHTNGRIDREAARRFWMISPWVSKHDCGECSTEAFADGVITELGLDYTREAFINAYLGWVKGVFPGSLALLDQLKGHYRLATLTNNNAAHMQRIERELHLGQYFEQVFASHEIHMKKPNPEIYRYVTDKLGVAPERIAFFDDNIECLQPARDIGWHAFHTVGLAQLRLALTQLGAL